METAAVFCGVSKQTLYTWLKRGNEEPNTIFEKLLDALDQAMAESEVRDMIAVNKAVEDGDWRAVAWRLERKFPRKWGKKQILEVSKGEEGSIEDENIHEKVVKLIAELKNQG